MLLQERDLGRGMRQESPSPADPIDRGGQYVGRAEMVDTRLRVRRLLREIEAALARIEDGTFGYCLETGEEIGLRRLEALPTATHLVEIQEVQEVRARSRRLNGV